MNIAAALSLPISLHKPSMSNTKKGVKGEIRLFAILGEEGSLVDKKNQWGSIFDVEEPTSKFPQSKGKFLDANLALEL